MRLPMLLLHMGLRRRQTRGLPRLCLHSLLLHSLLLHSLRLHSLRLHAQPALALVVG